MNNLIKFFNAALTTGTKVDEQLVLSEGAKRGYIIHPDCCTQEVLDFIKAQEFNPNSTFYRLWSDITEKDRFELLLDQFLHYASTYGTHYEGEVYCPNGEPININYKTYTVIRPVTEKEMFDLCVNCITTGVALANGTLRSVTNFIVSQIRANHYPIDLDTIANRDALCIISKECGLLPTRGENIVRVLYYQVFGNPMPIQGRAQLNSLLGYSCHDGYQYGPTADVSGIDLTHLTDTQMKELARVFLRYKKFFLGLKKNEKNAPIINRLRRMAKTYHKPMTVGFWENFTNLPWDVVKARLPHELEKLDNNFKITRLIQMLTMRKLQNATKATRMFFIRNGKIWIDHDTLAPYDGNWDTVREALVNLLIRNLAAKRKSMGSNVIVRFPERLSLACPVSEKKYLGNVPFGSTYDLANENNYFGVYWRGEWGTQDFDLHFIDDNGGHLGWNARYYDENQSIVFSGDMTTANPEATEMFYVKGQTKLPNGNLQLNRYNGWENSKFRLFFGQDKISNLTKNYMVDPNSIKFAEMGVSTSEEQFIGRIQDQKLYVGVMDLNNNRVSCPNDKRDLARKIMFEIMCTSYLPLKEILLAAGFIEYNETHAKAGIEPTIDLTNLQKNTLLDLFGN